MWNPGQDMELERQRVDAIEKDAFEAASGQGVGRRRYGQPSRHAKPNGGRILSLLKRLVERLWRAV